MLNSQSFMQQPVASPYAGMANWGAPVAPYMFSNPGTNPSMWGTNPTQALDVNAQALQGISPEGSTGLFSGLLAPSPQFSSAVAGADGVANPGFFDGMIGTKDAPGWGGLALGAAGGLASAFMGMKQYGLAKKTLAENKRQFQMNYDAQKTTTNTALEDRQRARVASNAGAYQSVGDYMSTNGIK